MNQPNIICLQAGAYTAKINIHAGANCISLRNSAYHAQLLREPADPAKLDNPYLYGMPILFPVNRISGGRFSFEGREYVYPVNEPTTGCHLHGVLHQTAFSLEQREENKAICVYRTEKQGGYMGFPHDFEIRICYELTEKGLGHTVWVTNLSDMNMPLLLGFHTTFNGRFIAGSKPEDIRVKVPITEEYERNMQNYLPTGRKPAFDDVSRALRDGLLCPFDRPVSRHYRSAYPGNMVIYDAGADLSLVYENDEKYGFRLIYNGNADGYICLEPQTCLANCPNAPVDRAEGGFDWIAPGATKEYTSRIYLAKGDRR